MQLKIKEITSFLESLAPLSSQESYDNSGLIVGDSNTEVNGALLSLDCTEDVVQEAIDLGVNLIISHHPIIFGGLKKLNGKNYVERTVIKAIKNDIAIYAIHTNLDNYRFGVNAEIGKRLNLENLKVLAPKQNILNKIIVFCPEENVQEVSQAMFEAGAGKIGDYEECSFEQTGQGYFKPVNDAKPTIGEIDKRESVKEKRIETLCSSHKTASVLSAMKEAHPYEEVAHDIVPLINKNQFEGAGMIGELSSSVSTIDFLHQLKDIFNCDCIRHTKINKEKVKKIAFCGGAGSFLLDKAKARNADIFITGDFKYHEFFDAEDQIIIADIGHFESEQYTPNLIHEVLKKKFITFALRLSKVNTNPINYL